MVSGKANSSSSGSDQRGHDAAAEARAQRKERRAKRPPRPLDQAGLHDLALSYVARFATTGAKLEAYLARKLRERGQAADEDADGASGAVDLPALVARMIAAGYVDDDVYARMRSRDLAARGFGARRIEQALWAAGVDEATRAVHAPGEAARRHAAVRMAQKRRLGPFGSADPSADPRAREKAVAAMIRAGHAFAHARFILDAASPEDIADWLAEADSAGSDGEGMNDTW